MAYPQEKRREAALLNEYISLERGGAGSAEKAAEDLKKVKHIIDELEE